MQSYGAVECDEGVGEGTEESANMKTIEIEYIFAFNEEVDVPDDWKWDGELDSLLELTDMSADHPSGQLVDWTI